MIVEICELSHLSDKSGDDFLIKKPNKLFINH